MMKLYVIGNGFDLHHNLPTKLNNFKEYMQIQHRNEFWNIDHLFFNYYSHKQHDDWNELETMLSCTTELDAMLEDAINSSEKDTDRASYWNDIQYNVGNIRKELDTLKVGLDEWNDKIDVASAAPDQQIHFYSNAIFLNFNYINSLQKLYGISEKQILHIHGSNIQPKVLGHNVSYDALPSYNQNLTAEDVNYGLEEDWRFLIKYQIAKKSFLWVGL